MRICLGLVGLIFFCACNRTLYAPNDMQIIAVNGRGDHKIGGHVQVIGEGKGIGAQALYAKTDHFAIKSQANFGTGSGTITTGGIFAPPVKNKVRVFGSNIEIAAGYHRRMAKQFWGAVFAGGGLNRLSYQFDGALKSSINYGRAFVQPELVRCGKYADLGFGYRSSYVNYFAGRISSDMPAVALGEFVDVIEKKSFFLQEGQFLLGGSAGRVYVKNSVTWLFSPPPTNTFTRLQFSTSIIYSISSFKPSKRKK